MAAREDLLVPVYYAYPLRNADENQTTVAIREGG
jgi:hypothetical protein